MENRRFSVHCEPDSAARFIDLMDATDGCVRKEYRPVNDKCHNIVYKYVLTGDKLSIVYDTKGKVLTADGPDRVIVWLEGLWKRVQAVQMANKNGQTGGGNDTAWSPAVKADSGNSQRPSKAEKDGKDGAGKHSVAITGGTAKKPTAAGRDKAGATPKVNGRDKANATPPRDNGNAIAQKGKDSGKGKTTDTKITQTARSDGDKGKSATTGNRSKTSPVTVPKTNEAGKITSAPKTGGSESAKGNAEKAVEQGHRGGVSERPLSKQSAESADECLTVKQVTDKRFETILRGLKRIKGVSCRLIGTSAAGKPDEAKTYRIADSKKQRVNLRYLPKKGILQLQGKRSNLFGEVQVQLNSGDDFTAAVKNYISVAGKGRAGDVQKMLKKRLPDACEFLSEQSKIDITIGLIDIYNTETRLTDYSSLLTPPYRGLEKFISDLQKAQGIEVKMIGQAYERPDGKYVLKSGFQKRIKSVIYAEVMADLYTEYFARRNFYTHSDNSDESAPRIITDKQEAVAIFDRLLDKINYNCKKLKEIGFTIR